MTGSQAHTQLRPPHHPLSATQRHRRRCCRRRLLLTAVLWAWLLVGSSLAVLLQRTAHRPDSPAAAARSSCRRSGARLQCCICINSQVEEECGEVNVIRCHSRVPSRFPLIAHRSLLQPPSPRRRCSPRDWAPGSMFLQAHGRTWNAPMWLSAFTLSLRRCPSRPSLCYLLTRCIVLRCSSSRNQHSRQPPHVSMQLRYRITRLYGEKTTKWLGMVSY